MQDRPIARLLYAVTALSAAAGMLLAFVISGLGTEIHRVGKPGLFDDYGQSAVGRRPSGHVRQWETNTAKRRESVHTHGVPGIRRRLVAKGQLTA
jgi:hypothetical protein